jgi:preprotein translocase subunit SecG
MAEMNNSTTVSAASRRPPAPLTKLLAVVMVVFCGILIFVYVATKCANPVMLDQRGKPLDQSSESAKPGAR